MMLAGHLLSMLIWLPIVGGFAVMALGTGRDTPAKWLSLLVASATLALSCLLYTSRCV